MGNPLLKYLMKGKKEDVFHSSAYGKVQSATGMGTVSSKGFSERMETDCNRRLVGGYKRSRLVGEARGFSGAKRYEGDKVDKVRMDSGCIAASSAARGQSNGGRTVATPPARRNSGISR